MDKYIAPLNSLPVGLELDGPRGSDRDLLALALAVEALFISAQNP